MPAQIYLAFRFHGNFYHSYRGDTPDELGFGKDIRIIRSILEVLDRFNQQGVPVRGTWDFENYFSLEKIMPEYCPDIIEAFKRRVKSGMDEMEFMSYNNGLVNAHTAREFEEAMRRAISNPAGSGLRDLFGENYANIVRPQEMTFTPIHLKLYQALGIDTISLYYSAVPFNGFSNFVPLLSTYERYNPLTLTYPGIDETMTLLPAYNVGDMADRLTLRRWIKQMRRDQLAMPDPQDLLLILDQDADDQFWAGFDVPGWLKRVFSTVRGLPGLIDNIKDLEYVQFTTPGRYLNNHSPVKTISFGQDTADGSFDGLSSWVEKWSNHRLYTGLERARILDLQTRRLAKNLSAVEKPLQEAFEARLKLLSTTHFGMAAPVMNLTREKTARKLMEQAVSAASNAFSQTAPSQAAGTFKLVDYTRGENTNLIQYKAHPSKALVCLPLASNVKTDFVLRASGKSEIAYGIIERDGEKSLYFVDQFEPEEEITYQIDQNQQASLSEIPQLTVQRDRLSNEFLQLEFDPHGHPISVKAQGREIAAGSFLTSSITYHGKPYSVSEWKTLVEQKSGPLGLLRMAGKIELPGGYTVEVDRELLLAAGLPYLYVNLRVRYPRTPDQGYNAGTAKRLQQTWDNHWQEVMPCEVHPALVGEPSTPLRVWKHNFCDHVSSFNLNYADFSKNLSLANINNQVTHAWVAVTNGSQGLLLAQNADVSSSVAFCPMRSVASKSKTRLMLNPFGTYFGPQYQYATSDTGLGNLMAVRFSAADQLKSYAPSYNGREQRFSLLIAPYQGDEPPNELRFDAEAYAYPAIVLNNPQTIRDPQHRKWEGDGVGETPDGKGA